MSRRWLINSNKVFRYQIHAGNVSLGKRMSGRITSRFLSGASPGPSGFSRVDISF